MTPSLTSEILITQDIDRLKKQGSFYNFEIDLEGTRVRVKLHDKNGRAYGLLFLCENYPQNPPSVQFTDPETFTDNSLKHWPNDGDQFFKPNYQPNVRLICFPGSKEYQITHPGQAYDPTEHRIGFILHRIRNQILSSQYRGGYS